MRGITSLTQQGKRRDIQLLRGLAVGLVLVAHFGGLVPSGFIGVDLFFAISGYVITLSLFRLLLEKPNRKDFLKSFWLQRFWRLAPSLSVVIAATLIAAFLILPPSAYDDQWQMALWSLFSAGNIGVEVITNSGYFDPASGKNWMLHLWSLGVEEQFYLLFPFLFLALFAGNSQKLRSVRTVIVLTSLGGLSVLMALFNDIDSAINAEPVSLTTTGLAALTGYYSPATRAWEFIVGAGAALVVRKGPSFLRGKYLWSVGIGLLVLSIIATSESKLWPGPGTVLPLLGIVLILVSPLPKWLSNSRFLAPLNWLGDRSYSAYLWHWPIWSVLVYLFDESPTVIGIAFFLTLSLSSLTFTFVERPIISWARNRRDGNQTEIADKSNSKTIALLLSLVSLPLVVGTLVATAQVSLERADLLRSHLPTLRIDPEIDCLQSNCAGENIDVLLVGDSHAGALSNDLFETLASRGLEMRGMISLANRFTGCPFLPNSQVYSGKAECRDLASTMLAQIKENPPRHVVIYGYTVGRFTTINSGFEQEIDLFFADSGRQVQPEEGPLAYELALEEFTESLLELNASVTIISGTPDFNHRPEEIGSSGKLASVAELMSSAWLGMGYGETISREDFDSRQGDFRAVDNKIANATKSIEVIDPWPHLCDPTRCSQIDELDHQLFTDEDHISSFAAKILAAEIANSLSPGGDGS